MDCVVRFNGELVACDVFWTQNWWIPVLFLIIGLLYLIRPDLPLRVQNWLTRTILRKKNSQQVNLTITRIVGTLIVLASLYMFYQVFSALL